MYCKKAVCELSSYYIIQDNENNKIFYMHCVYVCVCVCAINTLDLFEFFDPKTKKSSWAVLVKKIKFNHNINKQPNEF